MRKEGGQSEEKWKEERSVKILYMKLNNTKYTNNPCDKYKNFTKNYIYFKIPYNTLQSC